MTSLIMTTDHADKRAKLADAEDDISDAHRERILRGHSNCVVALAYSPDGKTLASGSNDKTIRLWDVASGDCKMGLRGHAGRVNAIAYSPNGETLASASDDTTIRLWHVVSGVCEKILWGHTGWVEALAYSPDGKTLASGSIDGDIRLWATGYVDTDELFGDIKNAAKTS